MDSVRNEERAGVPSERVGARQKHRGYRAPRPAAPGTGLVWSTPEPLAGGLTSAAGGRESPCRARSNAVNTAATFSLLYDSILTLKSLTLTRPFDSLLCSIWARSDRVYRCSLCSGGPTFIYEGRADTALRRYVLNDCHRSLSVPSVSAVMITLSFAMLHNMHE